jgi:hypothetical protein
MTTIVLSGPKSSEPQVRTALASQGFEVQRTVDNHGLSDVLTEEARLAGEQALQPVAFVTVTADDDQLDAVAACAQTLGYVLRLHHETPPPPTPDPIAATFADMQRQIDELRAGIGGGDLSQ